MAGDGVLLFGLNSSLETQYEFRENSTTLCNQNGTWTAQDEEYDPLNHIALRIFKGIAMSLVILATILGNVVVIAAVARFKSLRSMNNYFIVSLAVADLLVGLLVQPFNMYNEMVQGEWTFGHAMCNLFNSNDVFFSTASLLHLCCISCDRYIAILHPFVYERTMTRKKLLIMIAATWVLSALLSYVPIFGGWYTDNEHLMELIHNEACTFEVSQPYAFVSSSISFWIPCTIMVILYHRILRTALTQEKKIRALMKPVAARERELSSCSLKSGYDYGKNGNAGDLSLQNGNIHLPEDTDEQRTNETENLTPKRTKKDARKDYKQMRKLRKEHRAAKTLGIIMGSFIACMGPLFFWYTITFGICPEKCRLPPENTWVITFVFWIGYFNSCMNPIIYAFFNRDFQNAFRRLFRIIRKQDDFARRASMSSEAPMTPRSQRSENSDSLTRGGTTCATYNIQPNSTDGLLLMENSSC